MSTPDDQSDDAALAGEYVLRLLDAAEHRAFEARLREDAALRALVRDWEAGLAPLAADVAPVAPPARIKADLTQRLFPAPAPATGGLWRWITGGVLAAGLVAGAVLLSPNLRPLLIPGPALTASIAAEDGSLVVVARFDTVRNTLEIDRQTGTARPGRVLELWLIAEGATAPVSLGVLPAEPTTRIALPEDLAARMAGALLAISDEPPGGSPTGAPTGDVLAAGPVTGA